jgi:inner membrane transporter RhtA
MVSRPFCFEDGDMARWATGRHGTSAAQVAQAAQRVPPHAYFVVSAVFHYLGPAFAVLLFARLDALGVAWLRIASAAVVFAAWRRPWRLWGRLDGPTRRLLVAWAAVLAVMNCAFYLAIERLPLGTVAAIEFLPVVVLAALAVRTRRNVLALALAVAGVYLLTDVRLVAEPLGIALAAVNAVLFAGYMVVAAIVTLPLGVADATPAFTDAVLLAAAIGVGVSSSVIPYVTDQLAMARLSRATYALLVSLLPATATVIGVVVLTQIPSGPEIAGVALVVAGVGVHQERTPTPEPRAEAVPTPSFRTRG